MDDVSFSSTTLLLFPCSHYSYAQLKNIFRLHHDTACQTHDLIECKCHRGENEPESQPSQEAQDDSDDSDDERSGSEGLGGFVPASQWEGEPVDKKVNFRGFLLPSLHSRLTHSPFLI